jgi:hypothetical protein
MKKFNDVADILIELVARGGGNETLDPLYDLIADHPGSTNFTAEQGRDALLVAVARVVQMLAEGRQHIANQQYDLVARDLVALTDQFGRLAKLAAFLERSGQESQGQRMKGFVPIYRTGKSNRLLSVSWFAKQ